MGIYRREMGNLRNMYEIHAMEAEYTEGKHILTIPPKTPINYP